jgi:predicted transcriptional regulator
MQDSILFKILVIVKGNGNITSLLKDGYKYGQIANFMNELVVQEYVEKKVDKGVVISEKGVEKLNQLNKKYKRDNSDRWITPDFKNIIEKIGDNDVYLPNQKELYF